MWVCVMTPRSQHHDPHGVSIPPPVESIPPSGVHITPHPTGSLRHAHAEGDRFIPHAVTLQAHTPPHRRPQSQVLDPHALTLATEPRSPRSLGGFHARAERLTGFRETFSFLR